jgi:hypothetical protein
MADFRCLADVLMLCCDGKGAQMAEIWPVGHGSVSTGE